MRKYILFFVVILCACQNNHYERDVLWYDREAANWNEALPIGNGHIAAMAYGGAGVSRYDLNEETIYEGGPYDNGNPLCREHLDEIRRLVFDGKNDSAQVLAERYIRADSTMPQGAAYQPAGTLLLRHDVRNGYETSVSHYRRCLYVDSALSVVTYKRGGVEYREESFCSLANNVMAIRVTASRPGRVSLTAYLDYPVTRDISYQTSDGVLILNGKTRPLARQGEERLRFTTRAKVVSEGGRQWHGGKHVYVKDADAVTIYVAMATNFRRYDDISGDEVAKADSIINKEYDYSVLRKEHIRQYKKQFDRMELRLAARNGNTKPTDWRIRNYKRTHDLSLVELLFQYGRYLLISSSQPGCQPTNLQGKWNKDMHPSWNCNYTLNVNTEMNYWPCETANLAECDEPLIRMAQEMSEHGRGTARVMYGCRGWVAHHNTDLWRMTGAVCHPRYGAWPMAGAWLCENLWRHYEFNQDKEYLASVYDCMRGAAEFYLDFLVEDPRTGRMVVCPSLSPENGPAHLTKKRKKGNKKLKELVTMQAGVTMDNQMLYSLFSHVSEAACILGRDADFRKQCLDMRSRLMPMQVGKRGQLQEWVEDWDSPKDKHRHVSHLWGLYPGSLITKDSVRLFKAAKESMRWRGDYATGWSIAWKLCFWARLLDGNHANRLISNFINPINSENNIAWGNGGIYPNMLCAHPPFQIDGNFGFTAGIIEMLVQSHTGKTEYLPALPKQWSNGYVKGVRLRGGKIIKEMRWKDGKVIKIEETR